MPPKNLSTRRPFALACRRWREARGGITMADASRYFGIPYRTWQDWEAGIHEPRGLSRRLVMRRLGADS